MYHYKIVVLPSSNPAQVEAFLNQRSQNGERLAGIVNGGVRPYAVWEVESDEPLVEMPAPSATETISDPAPLKRGKGRPRKDEPFPEPESRQPVIVEKKAEPDPNASLPGVKVETRTITGMGVGEKFKKSRLLG